MDNKYTFVNVLAYSRPSSASCVLKTVKYQKLKRQKQQFLRRKTYSTRMSRNLEDPITVVNLSETALGEAEINLLSKGLSFCPTPHHIRKEQILDDLGSSSRSYELQLKAFFLEEEEEESDAKTMFCPLSTLTSKRRNAALETYIKRLGWTWNTNLITCRLKGAKTTSFPKKDQV